MAEMKRVTIPGYGTYDVHDPDTVAIGDALAGKAPAGYGLGGNVPHISSANDINKTGWYFTDKGVPNAFDWHIMHTQQDANSAVQLGMTFHALGRDIAVRRKTQGEWGEWEWVNPPMEPGKEYRTTERWNGKVVYTKQIDCGALPNATTKTVAHAASAKQIIRCVGQDITSGRNLPYSWKGNSVEISSDKTHICITTNENFSADTAYAQIWYTKD